MHRDGQVGVLAPLGQDFQVLGIFGPGHFGTRRRASNTHEVTQLERWVELTEELVVSRQSRTQHALQPWPVDTSWGRQTVGHEVRQHPFEFRD
ncbi:hypothetical protein AMK11_34730 [Streptomyces sp. CB02414]|nr:hypothetical protein AMK11_34730 [Streptomyces sp. CB02414]